MKESSVGRHQSLVPYQQSPKPPQPGESPFDNPPMRVSPKRPAILTDGFFVVNSFGNDRHDATIQ